MRQVITRSSPLLAPLLLALLAGVATASPLPDGASPDEPGQLRFAPDAFELLPLPPVRREVVTAEHATLIGELRQRFRRRTELLERLDGRKDGSGGPPEELLKRIAELDEELVPRIDELCVALAGHEIDDDDLERVRSAPAGELRVERYAHGLVLQIETLSTSQRELLVPAVHALDGAMLALRAQEKQLEANQDGDGAPAMGRAVIASIQSRRRQMERRFWTLIDYALDDEQRATLHERLPSRYQQPADIMTHILQLPGLTPAQATRFRAFFAEAESETAADRAEMRSLRRKLEDTELSREDRAGLRRQFSLTRLRAARLSLELAEAGKAILTPEQWRTYLSIPPMLTAGDRRRTPERLLAEFDLTALQRREIRPRATGYRQIRTSLQQEASEMRKGMSDLGPDSPQMEMMNAMTQGLQGRATTALRQLLHEVFLEVLDPGQVVVWLTTS